MDSSGELKDGPGSVAIAAVSRLRDGGEGGATIDLSVGEPDIPTPEAIIEAGIAALRAGETKYTPRAGYASLRQLLVDKLARVNGYTVGIDDLIVTSGGSPAVSIAIGAGCRASDVLLVPDPGWPNYELMASRLGVEVRRYRQDPEPGQTFDLEEIEGLIDERTRMIVLTSPSNPTGGIASTEEVCGLVDMARRHGLLICSDEAYESISYDRVPVSPASCGGIDLTFACYTLSKTFAMTGWRIGYIVVPHGFEDPALQLQIAISGCAPAMAQRAAERAFSSELPEVREAVESYRRRRDLAVEIASGAGLAVTPPAGAFYLWLDVSSTGLTGQEFTDRLRAEYDTLVSAGEVYSVLQRGRVRVSFVAPEAQLLRGMRRIADAIAAWS